MLKLKSSNSVESLREQVRALALKDSRFAPAATSDGKVGCGEVWVCELLAPDEGGDWKAILSAPGGKLFEVPFTIAAGVVKLGETSREVLRSVRYLPLSAKHSGAELPVAIRAKQFASEINASDKWMFAPGGVHTITPAAGEGSAEVTMRIDESTAVVLNASLEKLNAENSPQRAFFDKEHDEAAGATAWPIKFVWSNSPVPGIYCEHEPSEFGKELVQGKIIRAFSPSFYSDAALPKKVNRGQHVKISAGKRGSAENPARMTGLVFPACGTLTNNPAFRKILPLWAKNATGAHSSQTQTTK